MDCCLSSSLLNIEKNENRTCAIPSHNYLPTYNRFYSDNFGKNFWIPVEYKQIYKMRAGKQFRKLLFNCRNIYFY